MRRERSDSRSSRLAAKYTREDDISTVNSPLSSACRLGLATVFHHKKRVEDQHASMDIAKNFAQDFGAVPIYRGRSVIS